MSETLAHDFVKGINEDVGIALVHWLASNNAERRLQ
jgi:hypothetical protein